MSIIEKIKQGFKNLGIRWKIMGIVFLVTIILGGWASWQVYNATFESLDTYLKRTGISISKNVAARSEDYVFTNDRYRLHSLMEETLENNPDIRYLFIEGADGEILVSSFSEGIPRGLREVNSVNPEVEHNIQRINTEEGIICDIATPIFEGRSGTVRLGVSHSGIKALTGDIVKDILLMTGAISLAGLTISYYLSSIIIKPVTNLVESSKRVGQGDFSQKPVEVKSFDEVGELSKSFNQMIEGLQNLNKNNEDYRRKLEEKEKLRIQLLQKIITSQEEERKRIARELHDEAGQSLTSLKLGIKRAEDSKDIEEAREVCKDLRKLLDNTIDELKVLSRNLRPRVLDDLGLFAALGRYLKDYQERTGIKVEFGKEGLDNWKPDSIISTTIYRIIQEATNNTAKHSRASRLEVQIKRIDDKYGSVTIKDNGEGFDVNKFKKDTSKKNLGLFSMKERAAIIEGELKIDSCINEGTKISLKFPLEEVEDEKAG